MPASQVKNAVAVSGKTKGLKFLGRLAMYNHPDDERPVSQVVRVWKKHGLDPDLLPKVRTPVHVFERAVAKQDTRKGSTNGSDKRVIVKVDRVQNDGHTCAYQVTRQLLDKANRLIEHPKAMRVNFDKDTEKITVDKLDAKQFKALAGIEDAIRADYKANTKTMPGPKLRNTIRTLLISCGAQNLRRNAGGVYFVPDTYVNGANNAHPTEPILTGISNVLEELYGTTDADFYAIPLVNDEGEREMVRKHFSINAAEKSRELTEEAINRARVKGKRGVRQDMLTRMWNERRKLANAVKQFDDLVGVEKKEIEANIRDLDAALNELQDLKEA